MSSKSPTKQPHSAISDKRRVLIPELVVIIGTLATSTAAILIRFAQQNAPSLVIAAWRMCLATLILMPFVLIRYRPELKALKRNNLGLLACSGLFLAAHFATWISSLAYTSVASAVVLVATNPLWVALFSRIFLKERISRWVAAGMLIALSGGVLISLNDTVLGVGTQPNVNPNSLWGDFLALLGALFGAGYIIIGRRLRVFTSLPVYTFTVYGSAGLILLVTVLVAGLPLSGYQPVTYLWFLLLALVPQLIGHSSINWGLRYLPAAFVAVVLLSEPIGSSILAILLLNEIPTTIMVVGGLLILLGIGLASWTELGRSFQPASNHP
ncbi:MAG: EamA family transporter [Anaerolineaceae bacterium]|nr:EamA family transporter [Anaerolineaceae bacterium]